MDQQGGGYRTSGAAKSKAFLPSGFDAGKISYINLRAVEL